MTLMTSSALDRPLVPPTGALERYVMLTVQAPAGAVRRRPLNLALVIDASGSMDGQKLARARDAAAFVVRHLTSTDRVAVIAYDDEVTVVTPSTLLTPTAKTELLRAIKGIEAGGSTNLSGGWLAGCQEVARHQQGEVQTDRVLLLTDGQANAGITAIEELVEHARELRTRGIVTSTMGLGVDFNEELLEAMARHGGGRFQYVETATQIPDCVQGELGEMLQIAARKLVIEVELPAGVRYTACLNDFVSEGTVHGVRVHLGDLPAGGLRQCVLRLSVDASDTGVSLHITSRALYVDSETGRGTELEFPPAMLRYASQADTDVQRTHAEVAREVAGLLAASAREEAMRLTRRGDHQAAAGFLYEASVAMCAAPFAQAAMEGGEIDALQALAAEVEHGVSAQRVKDVHYSSYLRRERRVRHAPTKD